MIRVILWDIDGTLLNFKHSEKYAIRKCFSLFNMGECTDEMLSRYSEINAGYWKRLEAGTLTKEQVLLGRFEEFFQKEHLDVGLAAAFNDEYQRRLGDTVCFNDDGYEVVRQLKEQVKQHAVTNGTRTAQQRKLKNSGLDQLFDGVFISEEVGTEKPGIGFFEAVWDQIGKFPGDEVIIVGDSLTGDMQGGNNAGIRCCWYNPAGLPDSVGLKIDYEIRNLREIPGILRQMGE